jgi:hypothetical protein
MAKIVNLDGTTAEPGKPVEKLTDDVGLRKLLHCENAASLKELWLSRQCDKADVNVALLMQLVGDVQALTGSIGMLLCKLEILTKQTDTRVN